VEATSQGNDAGKRKWNPKPRVQEVARLTNVDLLCATKGGREVVSTRE